jgi:hypothetical protein
MKAMGVAYNKKVNKNLKISENEVKLSSVANVDISSILS